MTQRAWLAAVVLGTAAALAGCGAGHGAQPPHSMALTTPRSTTPAPRPPHLSADGLVVQSWADALRRGDVRRATGLFAVPARVANGGPPVRLRTRGAVRFFNQTLPCGAKVIASEPATHGFIIVTFVLTERPGGGGCGTGVGKTARTAFRVRHGRITDWLRVQDLPSGPVTSS